MSIKDPVNYTSYIIDIGIKLLNNHRYNNFINNQLDNTSQDTFVYKTDE